MSASATELSVEAAPTARRLWASVRTWITANLRPVLISASIGFLGGWLFNVALMVLRYQGYQVGPGSPVTGQGSMFSGTVFWFLASTILFSLIGYRRAVGRERFWADLRSLPDVMRSLFRNDGAGARIHLMWGFAVAMVLQQFISPALAGLVGVGVALSVPTLIGRLLMGFSYRVYSSFSRAVAPGRKVAVPGLTAMTVGMMGTAAAFLVGLFVNGAALSIAGLGIDVRVIVGLGAAGLAWMLTQREAAPPAAVVLLVAVAAIELYEFLQAAVVWADDGGWTECGSSLSGWLDCGDSGPRQVAVRGVAGGVATGLGSGVGLGVGSVLGQPGDGGPRGGTGLDDRPPAPGGEHGWSWTEDGEGINLPDWAPPGTVMPLPDGYPGPIVFDTDGDPLPTNDEGQVNWGGEWMDPADAAADIQHWARRRQAEQNEFLRGTEAANQRWRNGVNERARQAEAEMAARRQAEQTLEQIRDISGRHDWDDILDRSWGEGTIDESGNLDPDYVNRLRDVLRNRIGMDMAAPDPDPDAPSWIEEGARDTWNDARSSFVVRAGTGFLTGGLSEVAFQGADVADRIRENVDKAVDEGRDYTFSDAIRDAGSEIAEQNLPVNTIKILMEDRDPPPSALDIAIALGSDVLSGLDVVDSASRVRTNGVDFGGDTVRDTLSRGRQRVDEMLGGGARPGGPASRPDVPTFTKAPDGTVVPRDRLGDFGMPEQNWRHVNQVADQHLVNIQVRPSNPDTVRWLEQGAHPKPPDLKSKTISDLDTHLMPGGAAANAGKRGTVGYFEPTLPKDLDQMPPDLQDSIRQRFQQRADEFADQAPKMDKLIGDGKVEVRDGQIFHGGDGQPFTGDHDIYKITDQNGMDIPPAVKEQVVRDLSGPPFNAQHGAHRDWVPTTDVDQGIDAAIRDSHNPGGEGLVTAGPGVDEPRVTYNVDTRATIQSEIDQTLRDIRIGVDRPTGVMSTIEIAPPPPKPGILSDSSRQALDGISAGLRVDQPIEGRALMQEAFPSIATDSTPLGAKAGFPMMRGDDGSVVGGYAPSDTGTAGKGVVRW